MYAGRADQRYVRHDRVLTRTARVVAVGLLAGAGALAAPAAHADGVTVAPSEQLLYSLRSFSASGYLSGVNTVRFNGISVGEVVGDVDSSYFQGTFNVPAAGSSGVPHCGVNTVTVGPASGTLTADCAAIQVTPAVVGSAQLPADFTVAPEHFPLRAEYRLTVDGVPQQFTFVNDGTAIGFTGTPSCGTHQVVLAQTYQAATVSAQQAINVLCPTVTLTPATIAQPSEPTRIVVQGGRFHSGQPVSVLVDGSAVGSGTTNSDGMITLPFTAQGLGCGTHQVTLAERSVGVPLSATAQLAVTTCPTGQGTATLAIDPSVLQPDTLTHATGSGFTPNQPVVLTWQGQDGTQLLGTTNVTAAANGTIDTYCMVFAHDLTGARQLVATQGGTTATAPAVVDGGTMQPSSGDQLVFRR